MRSYPINRDFLVACVEEAADFAGMRHDQKSAVIDAVARPDLKYVVRGGFYCEGVGCPLTLAGFYTPFGFDGLDGEAAWKFVKRFDDLTRKLGPKLLEIV